MGLGAEHAAVEELLGGAVSPSSVRTVCAEIASCRRFERVAPGAGTGGVAKRRGGGDSSSQRNPVEREVTATPAS
jgi:hypothetical protein